jgi:two-component system, OmpR family, catabolic regulation response regulator CreB
MPTRPHILVIEDDPLVSEVVIDALEDRYETSHAETAPDGVEQLRAGGVDLVLLDCTLPGGLGEVLLPTADEGRVPVVLMSGNPGMAEQVPGRRPFVLKPFSLAALLETVQGVLGR